LLVRIKPFYPDFFCRMIFAVFSLYGMFRIRTLSPDPSAGILSLMNILETFSELARAVCGLI